MKALAKSKAEPGLWLEEVPVPEIGPLDVLIAVEKAGICGTDLHIWNWDDWARETIPLGLTIGHEFTGTIAGIGSHVAGLRPGMRVTAEGHMTCGHCRNCLAGRRHLCPNTLGIGVNRNGAFAEYIAMPAMNVWPCDPEIPAEIFAIFDPLGNAEHVAGSFDLVGEDVLITGAGPIGAMAAAMARHAGARHVVVTDVNDYRLELARTLGATEAVNVSRENLKDVMTRLKMTEGFDVGFEMSGNAAAFSQMIESMVHGGKIAVLGIQPGRSATDWNAIVFKGLTLKGIYGREMFENWYKLTAMIQSGMNIAPVITHRLPFERYAEAFEIMRSGQSGKIILEWA